MAGLAALLSFGSDRATAQTLEALSYSLAPRGGDEAVAAIGPVRLLIRAELPKINEQDNTAMIVDGLAETTVLLTRYETYGAAGLLTGQHPYALIVADQDGAVLARNLDGPPLYYARARGAVMVASEPAALIAAGVPAVPDEVVVNRFLDTGACDDARGTFFRGIRRVLADQVVEISGHTDGWAINVHPQADQTPSNSGLKLNPGNERIGVALLKDDDDDEDDGLPVAALLGAAISARGTNRSMPVYSANFPGLDPTCSTLWPALLGPVPDSEVKHRALPFFADEFDVDGFVGDLGEPAPGLADYLLWAMAKASGGEVDVLLSALGAGDQSGHLSRLADRVAARYGVGLRFPYRELGGLDDAARAQLLAIAELTLPPASLSAATSGTTTEPALGQILNRLRPELAATLLYPHHGEPDRAALARLGGLGAAERPELDRVWRRYVLERWLAMVMPIKPKVPAARLPERQLDIAGEIWQRRTRCVEPLTSGDRFAEIFAWHTAEFINAADRHTREALRRPWLLVVAGKPIAVAQGEARAIWRIEPGRLAHTLVRLSRGRTRLCDPWSMQVAIGRAGRWRMGLTALFASFNRIIWYPKIAGTAATSVSPPREHACPPAHLAVVGPVQRPDQAARQILGAIRRAIPEEIFDTLRGCAIVSADGESVRCLGWAGKESMPVDLLQRLCADNPMGQADERTPLVIALSGKNATRKAPQGGSAGRGESGARRPGKQTGRRR